MTSEKVKSILTPAGIASAKNELAFFFRRICSELHWDIYRWEAKLQRYLDRNAKLIGSTSKDRSYARGNLNSQFSADRFTWRTFMDALRFLGPSSARLTIELGWAGGRKTYHTTRLNLRQHGTVGEDADDIEMLEGAANPAFSPIPLSVDESIEHAQAAEAASEGTGPDAVPPIPKTPSIEEQLRQHSDSLRGLRATQPAAFDEDDAEDG